MANILYVTRADFAGSGFSGGMGTKTKAMLSAWSGNGLHKINWTTTLDTLESGDAEHIDVLMLELLAINRVKHFDRNMKLLQKFDGPILVYGSDSELLRWRGEHIDALKEVVTGWVANCLWQLRYFQDFGVPVLGVLREPIDTDLFAPAREREMVILAGGQVSYRKHSDFFVELFGRIKALDNSKYRTAYLGDAFTWGNVPLFRDLNLSIDLKAVTDDFYGTVRPTKVASVIGASAIGIVNSHYDTCNRFGMELNCGGVELVAGPNICFDEWEYTHRFTTVDECMQVLADLTEGFTKLPLADDAEDRVAWAQESFSYASTLDVFNDIMGRVL